MPSFIEDTDPIYHAVVQLFHEHGDPVSEPLQQSILLKDDLFFGCRFQGTKFFIDWHAEKQVFHFLNPENGQITIRPVRKTTA